MVTNLKSFLGDAAKNTDYSNLILFVLLIDFFPSNF